MSVRLCDLGERRILDEIIPKFANGIGSDCAVFSLQSSYLAVSTDPVPKPAAHAIAGDDDLFWMGWLLVTINASDIAASGARPHSFYASLDLPRDLELTKLERLLSGIRAACDRHSFIYAGGNLREGPIVSAVGTALGLASSECLTRFGAQAGSYVVVIGESGRFWSDVLRFQSGETLDRATSPLFSPVAKTQEMVALHIERLVTCSMDTSDGLAPTLVELSKVNGMRIDVDLVELRRSAKGLTHLERVERLAMGWGDWTVVVSVPEGNIERVLELRASGVLSATVLGRFSEGPAGVYLRDGIDTIPLGRLESERFAEDSWFLKGVGEYQRQLSLLPLPE